MSDLPTDKAPQIYATLMKTLATFVTHEEPSGAEILDAVANFAGSVVTEVGIRRGLPDGDIEAIGQEVVRLMQSAIAYNLLSPTAKNVTTNEPARS
jgi:hypothetical protein